MKAIEKMAKNRFEEAKNLLKDAEEYILKAHVAQTQVIQSQAAGEDMEYSLLFIHAQDTIMTSNLNYVLRNIYYQYLKLNIRQYK